MLLIDGLARQCESAVGSGPSTDGSSVQDPRFGQWTIWSGPVEAALLGIALGVLYVPTSDDIVRVAGAYAAAGILLGFRHAGRSMGCWLILGVSLYPIHLVAVALGREPPFLYITPRGGICNLILLAPSGLGVVSGASARWCLDRLGVLRRGVNRPIRLLPRSTRGWMAAVGGIGIGMSGIVRGLKAETIYAPGYDERRFAAVRVGMSNSEVQEILGPPLEKDQRAGEVFVNWIYSEQSMHTGDYERRRIFFKEGRVITIIGDHWDD